MEQTVTAVDQAMTAVLRRKEAALRDQDLSTVCRCEIRFDELLDIRLRLPQDADGTLH